MSPTRAEGDEPETAPGHSEGLRLYHKLVLGGFRNLLGRDPSEEEAANWSNVLAAGMDPDDFLRELHESPEAGLRATQTARSRDEQSAMLVSTAYQLHLGRPPSAAETEALTGEFAAGLGASAFVESVRNSDEAVRLRTARIAEGELREQAARDLIEGLYRGFLGRNPSLEEREGWMGSGREGLSLVEIALSIRNSEEATAKEQSLPGVATAPLDQAAAEEAVQTLYRVCLGRTAQERELAGWANALMAGESWQSCLRQIADSAEAKGARHAQAVMDGLSHSDFVLDAYEAVLGRPPTTEDLAQWERALRTGETDRAAVLMELFRRLDLVGKRNAARQPSPHAPVTANIGIMGARRTIDAAAWRQSQEPPPVSQSRFPFRPEAGIKISAIASLYKSGKYIDKFLKNITEQTIFEKNCELIIVDAASPDREVDIIETYTNRYGNIKYLRTKKQVNIYEAWNIAINVSEGKYITNVNLDDLRRLDSLEVQAAALDALPFIDIVYQDFLYYFDIEASFEDIERAGVASRLPIVTAANLLAFNSPHHAPMWRRALHAELGFFDEAMQSAGDYDFWLRCLSAGRHFFKLNAPHAAYFVNPAGLSSGKDKERIDKEISGIITKYERELISPSLTEPFESFMEKCRAFGDVSDMEFSSRYDVAQRALRLVVRRHTDRGSEVS